MAEAVRKPFSFGSMAAGLNNRRRPTELGIPLPGGGENTYLYAGLNVDIDAHGRGRRRQGYTSVVAGPAHSAWADGQGAFAVLNGTLTGLSPSGAGLAQQAIRAGMPPMPVSYSRGADGAVYWTNGATLRKVLAGQDLPPVQAGPVAGPVLTLIGGALPAGLYMLAVTIVGANGESPASEIVQIDVPANGGIRIQSPEALTVYASSTDGEVLTRQGALIGGTLDIVTLDESGRRCDTLHTTPMPAGSIVRHFNGAMLVAQGRILYVSKPFNYGVCRMSRAYVPFPGEITVIEPTQNGVWIVADQTYWVTDVLTWEAGIAGKLPYGAIPGTSGPNPTDNTVFWQSERGLMVADDQGGVKAVQEDVLAFSGAARGATLFRDRDGIEHILSARQGTNQSTAVAFTYLEAEVIRQGTLK